MYFIYYYLFFVCVVYYMCLCCSIVSICANKEIYNSVRMAESTLRRIQPLIFDENIADNFVNFEREWKVYQIAALSEKDKKVQAYTLMNLAGPDAILKSESFEYIW